MRLKLLCDFGVFLVVMSILACMLVFYSRMAALLNWGMREGKECLLAVFNGWFYGDRLRGVQSLRSEIGCGTRIIELRAFFSLLLHSSLFRVLFYMIRTIRSSITTN